MKLSRLLNRLLALLRRRRLDHELESEVAAHLELAERDALAAGMSLEQARQAARQRFGGIERMKEEHRDHRSLRWIETLARDLRYGLASLRRNPGFAVIAISVLALGIGANTAMFSLVDAVLLKPLPFPEPERIVKVWETTPNGFNNVTNTLDFLDWKRLNTVFQALSADRSTNVTLTGEGEPMRLPGRRVSADYFEVLGIQARMGRTFTLEEDQPGAAPVVVLSHAAWQTHFGGDPGILNRELVLDGEPNLVVGVLPPSSLDRDYAAFWKPIIFSPAERTRGSHWLRVAGRLRPGVSIEQAREQMRAIDRSLTELSPEWKREWSVTVEPYGQRLVSDNLRQSIQVAFGAVVLVLLIACANVANLLLARGATRQKEMSVRAALGASRGRLMGQLITESLVLCLLGAAAGVAVAHLLIRAATPLLAGSLPFTAEVGADLRVLGFAAAVAVAGSLFVGLFPALRTSFGKLAQSMSSVARGSSGAHDRLRRAIVVGEVALSLVLICGALLLFKSLLKLQEVETGVRTENLITMSVRLPLPAYPDPAAAARFYEAAVERIQAVPGIEQTTITNFLPLRNVNEGQAVLNLASDAGLGIDYKRVDPHYFATLGIPLLSGRGIDVRDRAGAPPVAVINEELARRMSDQFGFADPVGESVRMVTPDYVKKAGSIVETQIVGVIRSELVGSPGSTNEPVAYVPLAQVPVRGVSLIVHALRDPSAVIPEIRHALWNIDPDLAVGDVSTMQQIRAQSLSGARQPVWLIGAFSAVAALMAALGLYGVLAHAVTQQRREIGIRMALGAHAGNVLSRVLRNAMWMILAGVVLGLAGAIALTGILESLLFQVSPLDPFALALACVSMLLIGLLASFVPARRAASVDPMAVLRDEG